MLAFVLSFVLAMLPPAVPRPVTEVDWQPYEGKVDVTLWYQGCGTSPRPFTADLHCHRSIPDGETVFDTDWAYCGDWLDHHEWFAQIPGMNVKDAEAFLREDE